MDPKSRIAKKFRTPVDVVVKDVQIEVPKVTVKRVA